MTHFDPLCFCESLLFLGGPLPCGSPVVVFIDLGHSCFCIFYSIYPFNGHKGTLGLRRGLGWRGAVIGAEQKKPTQCPKGGVFQMHSNCNKKQKRSLFSRLMRLLLFQKQLF